MNATGQVFSSHPNLGPTSAFSRAFFGAKPGRQPIIRLDFFFALERSRLDRPIEASASEPDQTDAHARISIKPRRSAREFIRHRGTARAVPHFHSIRASRDRVPPPSPSRRWALGIYPPFHPLALRSSYARLRIRGPRREVSARLRTSALRSLAAETLLPRRRARFVYGHGGMVSSNSPYVPLFLCCSRRWLVACGRREVHCGKSSSALHGFLRDERPQE